MTQKRKEAWKQVRLGYNQSLMLKYIALTTKRSMASILTEYIEHIFNLTMKYRENQIFFDSVFSEDKLIVTICGRKPRIVCGSEPTEEKAKESIESVFAPKKKKKVIRK